MGRVGTKDQIYATGLGLPQGGDTFVPQRQQSSTIPTEQRTEWKIPLSSETPVKGKMYHIYMKHKKRCASGERTGATTREAPGDRGKKTTRGTGHQKPPTPSGRKLRQNSFVPPQGPNTHWGRTTNYLLGERNPKEGVNKHRTASTKGCDAQQGTKRGKTPAGEYRHTSLETHRRWREGNP